uniref:Mitochondrial 60S ribosomal protein L6 n=1 Tax=Arundo donax TaxID=35708 RepID=A0A0A8Y083_ARUDO
MCCRIKEVNNRTERSVVASSLLLLLPWPELDNFIDVQYAFSLVHLWRFAALNNAGKLMHSIVVNAGAADYVGFEAEDADSRWSGELYFMAVAQFQKQLTALAL